MSKYTVKDGEIFRLHDGSIVTGGSPIELDDESAAVHAHRISATPVAQVIEPGEV